MRIHIFLYVFVSREPISLDSYFKIPYIYVEVVSKHEPNAEYRISVDERQIFVARMTDDSILSTNRIKMEKDGRRKGGSRDSGGSRFAWMELHHNNSLFYHARVWNNISE